MGIIGVIPSVDKTFEVFGDFNSCDLIEGKLYSDPSNGRLYYYSTIETRSNPNTGYFPIWDGKNKIVSTFSKEKYFDTDVLKVDMNSISSTVNKELAESIIYQRRKSCSSDTLKPQISDGDNIFTQCIKGVICAKDITMVDLVDMGKPRLTQKIIESYYSALMKITFMRYDKWCIWVDSILHLSYTIDVYNANRKLLTYTYPSNKFDTGIVKYDKIVDTNDDPFKKIVKLLMIMENINKSSLKTDAMDDYTINNMMTTLSSNKPLSAQLFSRFIRMAKLSCTIKIFDNTGEIFEYKE